MQFIGFRRAARAFVPWRCAKAGGVKLVVYWNDCQDRSVELNRAQADSIKWVRTEVSPVAACSQATADLIKFQGGA